jgi:hypothetical protein
MLIWAVAWLSMSTVRDRSCWMASFVFGYRSKPLGFTSGGGRTTFQSAVRSWYTTAPTLKQRSWWSTISAPIRRKRCSTCVLSGATHWGHAVEGNNVDVTTLSITLALLRSGEFFLWCKTWGIYATNAVSVLVLTLTLRCRHEQWHSTGVSFMICFIVSDRGYKGYSYCNSFSDLLQTTL